MSIVQRVLLPECSGQTSRSILCHCFDEAGQRLAVSYGSEIIYLYEKNDRSEWQRLSELVEHESRVTGVDWRGEQLVSCGADRNAYVWLEAEQRWKPTLVLLRIKRAATCVRWCRGASRFAVGSSAKAVSICHYEPSDDLWVARQIRRAAKATVTCVDWHPDDAVLAVGSVDCRVRLYSVPHGAPSDKFGELLYEVDVNGWVHALAYSEQGGGDTCLLAFSTHLSTVGVISHEAKGDVKFRLLLVKRLKNLPFRTLLFKDDRTILAGGYDNKLAWITVGNGGGDVTWLPLKDSQRDGIVSTERQHTNSITQLQRLHSGLISSSGLDGQLLIWKV